MFGLFGPPTDPKLTIQLRRIERKLDAILHQLGMEAPAEEEHADLREMVAAGDKIAAIKLYRERTGVGLAEAKAAVEAL